MHSYHNSQVNNVLLLRKKNVINVKSKSKMKFVPILIHIKPHENKVVTLLVSPTAVTGIEFPTSSYVTQIPNKVTPIEFPMSNYDTSGAHQHF